MSLWLLSEAKKYALQVGLPEGGSSNQILKKINNEPYNVQWEDLSLDTFAQTDNTIFVDKSSGTDWDSWVSAQPHNIDDIVICGAFVYRCIQSYDESDPIAFIQPCSSNPSAYEDYWEVFSWGKSIEQPFASINQALRIVKQGVAGGQGIIVGSGLYTEDIVIPSRVFLIGDSTALEGTIKLGYQAFVKLNRHFASADNQIMVEHISPTDVAIYNCDKVRTNGRLEHPNFPFTGVKLFQNNSPVAGLIAHIAQCILGEDSEMFHTLAIEGESSEPTNIATDTTKFSGNNTMGTIGNLSETENVSSWVQWNFPAYVQYDLGEGSSASVSSYIMIASMSARAPRIWTIKGSNDNLEWTDLASETLAISPNIWVSQSTQTFSIPSENIASYRYYRIDITASYDTTVRLNQLQLIGGGSAVTFSGGAMLFDIYGISLESGAIIASSKSANNSWRGRIIEARYPQDVTGSTGFLVTAGSVMASGNNLLSTVAFDVTGGSLHLDFQNIDQSITNYTKTGGTVSLPTTRYSVDDD